MVRLPVRVKSVLSAGVPTYAMARASALSAQVFMKAALSCAELPMPSPAPNSPSERSRLTRNLSAKTD